MSHCFFKQWHFFDHRQSWWTKKFIDQSIFNMLSCFLGLIKRKFYSINWIQYILFVRLFARWIHKAESGLTKFLTKRPKPKGRKWPFSALPFSIYSSLQLNFRPFGFLFFQYSRFGLTVQLTFLLHLTQSKTWQNNNNIWIKLAKYVFS